MCPRNQFLQSCKAADASREMTLQEVPISPKWASLIKNSNFALEKWSPSSLCHSRTKPKSRFSEHFWLFYLQWLVAGHVVLCKSPSCSRCRRGLMVFLEPSRCWSALCRVVSSAAIWESPCPSVCSQSIHHNYDTMDLQMSLQNSHQHPLSLHQQYSRTMFSKSAPLLTFSWFVYLFTSFSSRAACDNGAFLTCILKTHDMMCIFSTVINTFIDQCHFLDFWYNMNIKYWHTYIVRWTTCNSNTSRNTEWGYSAALWARSKTGTSLGQLDKRRIRIQKTKNIFDIEEHCIQVNYEHVTCYRKTFYMWPCLWTFLLHIGLIIIIKIMIFDLISLTQYCWHIRPIWWHVPSWKNEYLL